MTSATDTGKLSRSNPLVMHHGYKGVKADMVIFDELHDEHDSREKLEAEASELVAEYAASGDVCDALYHGMLGLLDRQAAITEEKTRYKWVTASAEEIAAWRSKAEKLKELNEYHALQYELASEDADRLQAQVDKLTAEREQYRKLFGMALDWAHEITMLETSIDEGMA